MKCLYIYEWAISRFSIIWFNDNPNTSFFFGCKIKKVVYGFWWHFPRFPGNRLEIHQYKTYEVSRLIWFLVWCDTENSLGIFSSTSLISIFQPNIWSSLTCEKFHFKHSFYFWVIYPQSNFSNYAMSSKKTNKLCFAHNFISFTVSFKLLPGFKKENLSSVTRKLFKH